MSNPLEREFAEMEARLKAILPETYQDRYEEVQPVSMGSAQLKYGADGRVPWDEIWGSFCDLAMAGGPPHKGKLLEPASADEIAADPDGYRRVVDEICRGIALVADLKAVASPAPGWVRVDCLDRTCAQWLVRAIVMENVSARSLDTWLDLPAGPAFRVEKEIKNVITSVAKTNHYWDGHLWRAQRREIARIFAALDQEGPLVQPARPGSEAASAALAEAVQAATGLAPVPGRATASGWLGFPCPDVRSAIWMMRALVVSNVLARREDTVLFVPVDPAADAGGRRVSGALARAHAFARLRGVLA